MIQAKQKQTFYKVRFLQKDTKTVFPQVRIPNQIQARPSGFDLVKRSIGAESNFQAASEKGRLKMEWSGSRSNIP